MIGKEVTHYKILDRLGGGGMGVVYKAEDTRLGRIVALKFLNTELLANDSVRRRFLHEARAASVIDHPNVCHVYEVGEAEDGRYFMAMSYCEGRSLRDVISSGPVAPREAFSIAFAVAQGLWAAHRRNIVHRDIKPANVILTNDGFVRIVDFGLALLVGDSRVTTSGVTVGTVAYMSPEQTSGSTVAPNTDIWSLGVTLYELLTGHLPFRGDVNAALVYSIVHEPYQTLPSSIPIPVARVVNRCLEKDPAKRYQTIEELLEDMVKASQELGWESSVASATIAPILNERRKRALTRRVAIGVAAAAVIAGSVWAWREFRSPPSLYVTETRLAVLPLKNLLGADREGFVDGLSEHISRVVRWTSRDRPSVWIAPHASVVNADLPEPTDAAGNFGANRVLTGDVQRFQDGIRVNLALLDARSGKQLGSTAIPFVPESANLFMDTLTASIAGLLDLPAKRERSPWRCSRAPAAMDYLEGLSLLRRSISKKSRGEDMLDPAVATLDRGTATDPDFAALLCADGSAKVQQYKRTHDAKTLATALALARKADSLAVGFPEAGMLLGDIYTRMNLPDSAEASYRRSVTAEPGYPASSRRLADFYEHGKRIDEAEQTFQRLIARHPDFWFAHRALGDFYFKHDRLDSAAPCYQASLRVAPADPIALNNLGAVYHRQGNWVAANALFLRAFKLRPDCESSSNVAVTLYFERKFTESAKYYEFALQHCDTTQHLPWGDLARALYWAPAGHDRAMFYYRKALAIARKAFEETPDDIDLMAFVIDYTAMAGDEAEARIMIDRIKPLLDDNAQAMYRVGATSEKLGQRDAALDLIGNAIRHGFPLSEIRGDPMLESLQSDPVFVAMIHTEEAAQEARAAPKPH